MNLVSPIPVYLNSGRYGGWVYRTENPYTWNIPSASQDPEVWCGGAIFMLVNGGSNHVLKIFSDGTVTTQLTVTISTSGRFSVYRGTPAGTLLASSTTGLTLVNTWYYLEFHCLIDDTVGAFELRLDGVNVVSGSGVDTRNGGTSPNVSAIEWSRPSTSSFMYLDDLYVTTGDGVGVSGFQDEITIEGIVPNGNGNYSQLVGQDGDSTNNYLNVDERPFSAADYNGSPTAGQKDTYAYSNLTATTGNILGSVIHFGAMKNLAGFIKGRRVIRISATDYAGADTPSLSATMRYFSELLPTSPATAVAWTIAEVNGLEAGFEVRSA